MSQIKSAAFFDLLSRESYAKIRLKVILLKKQYTLKEIAQELNVSRATIDRVIHNRGDIGADTVKRVKEFLEEVGYRPNQVGRSLAKRLQKKIALLFHATDNEIFEDIKHGMQVAEAEIRDFGFSIEILPVDKNSEEQLKLLRQVAQEADAIAISPYEPDKFIETINEIVDAGKPVITFNNDVAESKRLCYIGTDYYRSGKLAGELLGKSVKSGKVLVISGKSGYWQSQQRQQGFEEVVQSYPSVEIIGPICHKEGSGDFPELLRTLDANPDVKGIFVMDNYNGIIESVCDTLHSRQPTLDIVTLDLNSECVKGINEGMIMATIAQDPFSQGYYAVKKLFHLLFHQSEMKHSIYHTKLDVLYKENLINYKNQRLFVDM